MQDQGIQSNDQLDDTELLAEEARQRAEFQRLDREEPHLRDTTYGILRGSAALVDAWERWWETNTAARMRGLLARGMGR